MEQLNKIELRGNVGNVRISDSGMNKMARFSLATNYVYKNKDGEMTVETTWHNVVAWENKLIRDLDKLIKGCPVYVCGRVRCSRYTTAEGEEKQAFEVIASKVNIVSEGAVEIQ